MTSTKYYLFISILLPLSSFAQKQTRASVSGKIDGHTYVDLGLPSGKLWATCNVGTNKATGMGEYFAWGETQQKDEYRWKSYEWGHKKILKYCANSEYGNVDKKTVLDSEDDAATANWGSQWRMPTPDEMKELKDRCDWQWTDNFAGTGVAGSIGTSKANRKVIFLPAAGFWGNNDLVKDGESACYWSTSVSEDDYGAQALIFTSDNTEWKSNSRYCGLSVRAVADKR